MRLTSKWATRFLLVAGVAGVCVTPAWSRMRPEDPEHQYFQAYEQEVLARMESSNGRRGARPMAIPNIFETGTSVLNVGNLVMKVTNNGLVGNPFTNVSSDPSCQWPGTSAVEYMNFAGLAFGAVNPLATDPNAIRRVSSGQEWRPATLDVEDKVYRGYDGIVNGVRFVNDDGDLDTNHPTNAGLYDEDFLDGRDNDGDGQIDEDFAAIGQQMFTCVIRDDTPQAIAASQAERHVPLGVECRQTAWAYSVAGFTDFNVVNWKFYNRSGHDLDSVAIAFRVDMDCGPTDKADFFSDDFDIPQYPFGRFLINNTDEKWRMEKGKRPDLPDVDPDSAACPRFHVTVQGFSVADNDGDEAKTPGVPHFLLIDHTIDPTGLNGPRKVGFRAYRSFPGGQPYVAGGNPIIDQQRFEFMTGFDNISSDVGNPAMMGFINAPSGVQRGDYSAWASIGPWLKWLPNEELECTFAIGIKPGTLAQAQLYSAEYQAEATNLGSDPVTQEDITGVVSGLDLLARYPALENALAAQLAFEGAYETRAGWPLLTDFPGRETPVRMPPGQISLLQGCEAHDASPRFVDDRDYVWFDFDCNYCTGVYSSEFEQGLFQRIWLAESPPPSPNTNLGVTYNFTDNPDRRFPPAGDGSVTIAWDNLSELTPDPKTQWFDFRAYQIWKVSDWTRPVGSSGPGENDWTLLAEYRQFECFGDTTCQRVVKQGDAYCRELFIPQTNQTRTICLNPGDLFDPQSGDIIRPDPSVLCIGYPDCLADSALSLGGGPRVGRIRYPVGRYRYVDRNVKNGFVYFYSVTAKDSTDRGQFGEKASRRAAVEAEGIVPQGSVNARNQVWVVPNPYRGLRAIAERPSAWDLTPNASDPTGTHIDFLGLPDGKWTIKIFTLSGDLVTTITDTDAVDASLRTATVVDRQGNSYSNVTRQQDTAGDGQARWNLISRNGQDVVSGIYLFTVQSRRGTERGKFVIIR